MTGAPVPEGATVVVMQEVVQQTGPGRIRLAEATSAANICARGEDLRRGEVVLRKGHLVTPARIALLGAVGCTAPLVYRQPRVGILATGDELVEPTAIPGPAQLRNSNSLQLCAQVEELGALARYHGIAPDRAAETTALLGRAQAESDMILLSGGVSTGAFDLVPQALVACGYAILFDSVAMQPGKPTLFARAGQRYCCGLPGNPAAAFVVFERLVKPFLYGLMGHEYRPRVVPAVLAEEVRRRSAARQAVLPVAWAGPGRVALVEYHGSAHVGAMARADGLLTLPVGVSAVPQGTTVDVRLL
jgi:molybdopterin molybdotransferase